MRGQRLAVTGSDRFLPLLCLRPLAGALMQLAGCWCMTFASAGYASSALWSKGCTVSFASIGHQFQNMTYLCNRMHC